MTPWRSRHAVRSLAGLALLALVTVLGAASAQAAGHGGSRHTLPGTKPTWTAAASQAATPAPTNLMHAKVWLAPQNGAQLDALAQAVSDPSSSQYGQFITADQYAAQYAPAQDQVSQVSDWLTQAGLSVDSVGPDNHYVAVSGTTDAVNAAFGTRLATFVVNGQTTQAPDDRPLGAGLAVRGRARGDGPDDVRSQGRAGRLRSARRVRELDRVLALLRPGVGDGPAPVPGPDASACGLRLHADPAPRRVRRRQRRHLRPGRGQGPDGRDRRRLRRHHPRTGCRHLCDHGTATGRSMGVSSPT